MIANRIPQLLCVLLMPPCNFRIFFWWFTWSNVLEDYQK